MRRLRPLPPQRLFSGREFGRLMSMLMMLGVLWMMISRASDPGVWRWLANDPDGGKKTAPSDENPPEFNEPVAVAPRAEKEPAQPPAEQSNTGQSKTEHSKTEPTDGKASASESPSPTMAQATASPATAPQQPAEDFEKVVPGPTDQDEEEWDAVTKDEFQAITDKDVLAAIEMPLYWRMVKWTRAQTFAELSRRAQTVSYVQLWEDPEKYRGKLVRLKTLHLRQVFGWDPKENSADVKRIYEARGWTEDSKSFPYIVVFCDKPPKLPQGSDIYEEATFVGYFLKQMSYRDGLDIRRAAPLLVGRLRWQENLARTALRSNRSQSGELWWVLAGGGLFLALVVGSWVYRARFPRKRRDPALMPTEEKSVEEWIDKIGQDEPEEELQARNGRGKHANGRHGDSKPLDWTDPGLHDETYPGFHDDST